ncbi:MAG TPA: respiratory nitrate reductase subunit gamma [Candidatus Angelobacter sp.]|nr:respiratory nitrate reductase subunit gamma [Candidatus Angelobacter sp.]
MNRNLLFSAWPYVAGSLFLTGIVVRYLLEHKHATVVKEEMSEAWRVFSGSRVWRLGVIVLLGGHAGALLFPQTLLAWNRVPGRLYLLEAFALIAALTALAGAATILWQHLGRSNRSVITELSDTVFIALLLVGIISGLLMAVLYRWGSSWGALILTPYVVSLLRANPAGGLAEQMPFVVRLHVFSTFAAVAVLPLTRLAAFFVFAINACLRQFARPVSAAGRSAEAWLRRHNPASWLWPEED